MATKVFDRCGLNIVSAARPGGPVLAVALSDADYIELEVADAQALMRTLQTWIAGRIPNGEGPIAAAWRTAAVFNAEGSHNALGWCDCAEPVHGCPPEGTICGTCQRVLRVHPITGWRAKDSEPQRTPAGGSVVAGNECQSPAPAQRPASAGSTGPTGHGIGTLRALVEAWQRQGEACKRAFDLAVTGINRELDAVGGYATTSPDKDGYCKDYTRYGDTFGGGVTKAGRAYGGTGPRRDIVAPHHPDVGDRCFALENAWRKEAYAHTDTLDAVRAYVKQFGGGDEPENVALALVSEGGPGCP